MNLLRRSLLLLLATFYSMAIFQANSFAQSGLERNARVLSCSPSVLHQNETLILRLGPGHGSELAIKRLSDGVSYFLVVAGRPEDKSLLMTPEEFLRAREVKISASYEATPWADGAKKAPIFSESGTYQIYTSMNLETDGAGGHYCNVRFASSMPVVAQGGSRPGQAPILGQVPVPLADAEILRRAESRQKLTAVPLIYLYETVSVRDAFNVAAINWFNLGSNEVRELYDQLYMAAQQYQGRAIRSLGRTTSALAAGNSETAAVHLKLADYNIKQMQISYSASIHAYIGDMQAAERTARTIETAGSVAAFAVGVGAAPAVVAMLEGVDFVGRVLGAGLKGGWGQATREAAALALTTAIIKFVPLSELGGKTIEKASAQTARRVLSDLRLQSA